MISLPAWIDIEPPRSLGLPEGLSKQAGFYAEQVQSFAARGIGSAMTSMIGLASVAAGPAAPFVAGAAAIGSVFASLFSGGPSTVEPPLPKIIGANAETVFTHPLDSIGRAVAVGRFISGHGQDPGGRRSSLRASMMPVITLAAREVATTGTVKGEIDGPFRVRHIALMLAATDYKLIFDWRGSDSQKDEYARGVGRMLRWATPRARTLSLLASVHYYLMARAYQAERGRMYKLLHPNPVSELVSADWAGRVVALAYPIPVLHGAVWQYMPWDVMIARDMIASIPEGGFDDWGPIGLERVAFPGHLFAYWPRGLGDPVTKRSNMTYDAAWNYAFALPDLRHPSPPRARVAPPLVATHMALLREELATMKTSRMKGMKGVMVAFLARQRARQKQRKELQKKRQPPGTSWRLVAGGAAATAAAAWLLIRR